MLSIIKKNHLFEVTDATEDTEVRNEILSKSYIPNTKHNIEYLLTVLEINAEWLNACSLTHPLTTEKQLMQHSELKYSEFLC